MSDTTGVVVSEREVARLRERLGKKQLNANPLTLLAIETQCEGASGLSYHQVTHILDRTDRRAGRFPPKNKPQ